VAGQTGELHWYRLSGGVKTDLANDGNDSYEILATEDVGARIQVDYLGTGSFGGSISVISDVVEKRAQPAPRGGIYRGWDGDYRSKPDIYRTEYRHRGDRDPGLFRLGWSRSH